MKLATNLELRLRYIQPQTDIRILATVPHENQSKEYLQDIQQIRTDLSNLRQSLRPNISNFTFGRPRLNNSAQVQCTLCHRFGHGEATCFHRQRNQQNRHEMTPLANQWTNDNGGRFGAATTSTSWNNQQRQPNVHFAPGTSNRQSPRPNWPPHQISGGQDPRIPRWNGRNQQQQQRYNQQPTPQPSFKRTYAVHHQPEETQAYDDDVLQPRVSTKDTSTKYVSDLELEVAELTTKLNRMEASAQSRVNAIWTPSPTQKEEKLVPKTTESTVKKRTEETPKNEP